MGRLPSLRARTELADRPHAVHRTLVCVLRAKARMFSMVIPRLIEQVF